MMTNEGTTAPEDAPRKPEAEDEARRAAGGEAPADGEAPTAGAENAAGEAVDVETLRSEAARAVELADKLKRVEAGFVNETKRLRRQELERQKFAIEGVVVDLLPVLDALHSAHKELGEDDPAREGLDLVGKQLESVLSRHGVTEIEALGQAFDPGRHQAMMMVENAEYDPQTVCEVLRPGYELHGRVVRAAEVLVVKAPEPAEADDAGDADGSEGD